MRLAILASTMAIAAGPHSRIDISPVRGMGASSAITGIVALRKAHCDHFIVATGMGYDLLEWYGGNDPSEGDELVGKFEEYGFHDI
jgi:hypothetical protein